MQVGRVREALLREHLEKLLGELLVSSGSGSGSGKQASLSPPVDMHALTGTRRQIGVDVGLGLLSMAGGPR